jgi:hypothetical protein
LFRSGAPLTTLEKILRDSSASLSLPSSVVPLSRFPRDNGGDPGVLVVLSASQSATARAYWAAVFAFLASIPIASCE